MRVQLRCKQCKHLWSMQNEPQFFAKLSCPACKAGLPAQVGEDLANALEDALAQLWSIGRHVNVDVQFTTPAKTPVE